MVGPRTLPALVLIALVVPGCAGPAGPAPGRSLADLVPQHLDADGRLGAAAAVDLMDDLAARGPPPGMTAELWAWTQAERRANVETATAMLGAASLRDVVRLAGERQSALLAGRSPVAPELAVASTASQAIADFAARHGGPLSANDAVAAQAYDALPAAAQGALARVLAAFAAFEDAARAAGLDGRLPRVPAIDPAQLDEGLPARPPAELRVSGFAEVYGARLALLDAALDLQRELQPQVSVPAAAAPPMRTPSTCLPAAVCVYGDALCLDLSGMASSYDFDCLLSIDSGGNDVYRNNAGGNGDKCRPSGASGDFTKVAGALIDLGGDDTYGNLASPRPCGVSGGAAAGVAFLYDAVGNDHYVSGELAANGGGHLGAGFLLDAAGNDVYDSKGHATNGGTFIAGSGLLVDGGGADTYNGGQGGSNGGGYTKTTAADPLVHPGSSMLVDLGGAPDTYNGGENVCVPGSCHPDFGVNGATRQIGHAFLLDDGGDDHYTAGVLGVVSGQPAAVDGDWGANGGGVGGFLYDGGGNDVYVAASSATNGANGGFLYDGGGADRYWAEIYGANGGASGMLIDAGDAIDWYMGASGRRGANGGGGLLFDNGGAGDCYIENFWWKYYDLTWSPKDNGETHVGPVNEASVGQVDWPHTPSSNPVTYVPPNPTMYGPC